MSHALMCDVLVVVRPSTLVVLARTRLSASNLVANRYTRMKAMKSIVEPSTRTAGTAVYTDTSSRDDVL